VNLKSRKVIITTSLICLVIGFTTIAQDAESVDMKSMSKKERKEYKEKQAIENKKKIIALLHSKSWVLEATSLQVKNGQTFQLQPTLNFVGADKEIVTVQLGSSFMLGPNGVGGITMDGKPSKYQVNEGKKPTSAVSLTMMVSGPAMGTLSIFLTISTSGNATASMTDLHGQRLTYRGDFRSLAESRVFKGMTTF